MFNFWVCVWCSCPVPIICNDPDFTTTDDYICTCPSCDEAVFTDTNLGLLNTYPPLTFPLRFTFAHKSLPNEISNIMWLAFTYVDVARMDAWL